MPTTPDSRANGRSDFGRDGVAGLVSPDRALRAREVSRPSAEDFEAAEAAADELLARFDSSGGLGKRK